MLKQVSNLFYNEKMFANYVISNMLLSVIKCIFVVSLTLLVNIGM